MIVFITNIVIIFTEDFWSVFVNILSETVKRESGENPEQARYCKF